MVRLFLITALSIPVLLPGCGGAGAPSASAPGASDSVTGAEAKALVASGAFLLDVRTTGEVAGGALAGSTNIPIAELETQLTALPKDKPIVVYCASGARSAAATRMLRAKGYDARDMGPMSAWPR